MKKKVILILATAITVILATAKSLLVTAPVGNAPAQSTEDVWLEDALPASASAGGDGGDGWTWVSSNPSPYSGSLSHQSNIASGEHQHYFFVGATQTLQVNAGDRLYTYVYLDPANTPSEVMLQWYSNEGGWEHRAYWGANDLGWGMEGTDGRRYMGSLPAAGTWVRLEIPAILVGLEGKTVSGMAFTLYGGRAAWDRAGKISTPSQPTENVSTWMEDALPAGAVPVSGGDNWTWVSSNPSPYSGSLSHQSNIASGIHQHFFTGATQTLHINAGDRLYAYVYLDPANSPSEVMLQWCSNESGWVRAYWGANNIPWGTDGTDSRLHMGTLPGAGIWVRLEVPAIALGLVGDTVTGMAFTLYDGRATWDQAGKITAPAPQPANAPFGSLMWHVQQARADGRSQVELATEITQSEVHRTNLCDAINNYAIVRVQGVSQKGYPQESTIVTWTKLRVLEVLKNHNFVSCPNCGRPGTPPADMLPLNNDELLVPTLGGVATVDGMTVTQYVGISPAFDQPQNEYVIFINWDQSNKVGYIDTLSEGMAKVTLSQYLGPNAPNLGYTGFIFRGLTERYGPIPDALTLDRLRAYINGEGGC